MTELAVLSAGPATSLQDAGRFGWQRFGVGPAGAMDRLSLALANVLVGNQPGQAAIEFALAGGRLQVVRRQRARSRWPAPTALLKIDGRPVPPLTSATVHDGQTIELATARSGVFFYLAVAGGFAIAPTLGSLSLHHRTGIGGLEGRTLRAGDRLPLGHVGALRSRACPPGASAGPGRAHPRGARAAGRPFHGRRHRHLGRTANTSISEQADRMGMRLTGPADRAQRQGLQHRLRRHPHGWHAGARQRACR